MLSRLSRIGFKTYKATAPYVFGYVDSINYRPFNYIPKDQVMLCITDWECPDGIWSEQNCILLKMHVKVDDQIKQDQKLCTVFQF